MKRIDYIFFFKFQSDSINTIFRQRPPTVTGSLNSNLILLIRLTPEIVRNYLVSFKFQSDSINTVDDRPAISPIKALNSNLILLILVWAVILKLLNSTLNSNLILLIPKSARHWKSVSSVFKFQSDSINTTLITPVSSTRFL